MSTSHSLERSQEQAEKHDEVEARPNRVWAHMRRESVARGPWMVGLPSAPVVVV